MHTQLLSHVQLFATPWMVVLQVPPHIKARQPQVKEHQGQIPDEHQEVGRVSKGVFLRDCRESMTVEALISDFKPAELEDNKLLLFVFVPY